MSTPTRRTLVGFLGLAAAGGAEAFASPVEKSGDFQFVAGAVTDERMAHAIEQLARAVRAGAVSVERITVHSEIAHNEIEGRQTITITGIHKPEVPVA